MEQTRESLVDRVKRLNRLLCKSLVNSKLDVLNGSVSREVLLDSLLLLYDECNNEFLMKDPLVAEFIEKYRSTILKIRDLCISIGDFESIKVISKGRFAEVAVVRGRDYGNIYVIKKLRKSDILSAHESICFENERNLMLLANKHEEASKWIPELFYSFQNMKYIYYVMEFCPGGNLNTMLEYYKNDIKKDVSKNVKENVPEPMLKFYIPEMIQAIQSVHLIGFAHRDIKPDNFVFDKLGHLKLIDFGSSAKVSKNGVISNKLTMNIPHYTAPEIYKFQEKTGKPYDYQCDWWSLGVVLFELITGSVPFTSEEVSKLHLSINYTRKIQFPKDVCISSGLKFLVQNLLQPVGKRIDYKRMIALEFFEGVKWTNLENRDPPFVPSLTSREDTSYFNTFDVQRPTPKVEDFKRRFTGRNLPFLGFTFLGNIREQETESISTTVLPCILPTKMTSITGVTGRRQTEHFKKNVSASSSSGSMRHSICAAGNVEAASECSNDSYQSAASVRLENEVDQLHLFYNEKALIIEEKIRNQFHDVYNCMTEDQHKLVQEKEELTVRLSRMEREYDSVVEELKRKTQELQDYKNTLDIAINESSLKREELKTDYEEQINKFKNVDKLKNDIINKLKADLADGTKVLKELEKKLQTERNEHAVKLALLNETKDSLRSKSAERDQNEQENASLKNRLSEANKKISQLTADLEKKNKVKLDLEVKMTSSDRQGARQFTAQANNKKIDTGFEKIVKDVLKEHLLMEKNVTVDKNLIDAIYKRISELHDTNSAENKEQNKLLNENSVVPILKSQIERLESQLVKEEQLVASHRDMVNRLTNEISQVQKEMSTLKIELQVTRIQSKTYEEQLKSIQVEKVNSQELVKQLENTIKGVLQENLSPKEKGSSADFESMFNKVQRRLSILTERQIVSHVEENPPSSESSSIQVLQAQIERLEEQLEKSREKAILQREEASTASSKLALTERELSNLKIDLRIAQRETKQAEAKIKELQDKLQSQTGDLSIQLKECCENLEARDEEIKTLKESLKNKTDELHVHEVNIEDKMSVIHSLAKEVQTLKSDIATLTSDKKGIESELMKRHEKIKILDGKLKLLNTEVTTSLDIIDEFKRKECEWKSKCSKLESEIGSLRETCEIQDQINVAFEKKQEKLEEDLQTIAKEKHELQVNFNDIKEELRSTRKMLNETKSLKSVVDDEVRRLKDELQNRDMELKILVEEKEDKSKEILYLEEKIQQFEECILQTNDSIDKSNICIEMMRKEKCMLKEERTDLLTRLHRLKEENMSLQQELNEAIEEINGLQQIHNESQLVLDQVKAYYEDRHMKDTTTLQQYSKLNEFLQTKVDGKKQKRTLADKLFRLKGKENSNPKEIENLLYSERKKNKELAEILYQTRTEMMILKGNENLSKYSSPKQKKHDGSYTNSEYNENKRVFKESAHSEISTPLHARVGHNIPHKFDTKLCKKVGVKCAVCGQTVSMGHMSQCKECHVRCHVVCSVNMAPSCGLSKALMNQIPAVNKKTPSATSLSVGSSVNSEIEGSLWVLRNKRWNKVHIVVDPKGVSLFEKAGSQKAATERIEFNSVLAIDENVNLDNIPNAENRRAFKISFLVPKRQTNVLVMLASNEDEKANWISVVKRNVPMLQKQISFKSVPQFHSKGSKVIECEKSNQFDVTQIISLSSELALMATEQGLFSLKLNTTQEQIKNYSPVKITGVDEVSKIKILTKLRLALFICGEKKAAKKCDLRMLVSNAEAAECSSPKITITDVSSLEPIENCKLLATSSCNSLLAIATDNYIIVLKETNDGFDIIKFEDNVANVVDMVFTIRSLFYCTEKEFYCVNLGSFEKKKLNIFKQVVGDDSCSMELKAIVKINTNSFLVCDRMFGIFVNECGRRIQSEETIKWHLTPHKIVYNKPFLCLSHDSCVSLVYLPSSNEDSKQKYKFSIIDYHQPSLLGVVKEPMNEMDIKDPVRGFFIKENCHDDKYQVFFLDPLVFTRRNPKESWSSIDTQLTGETTDEECVRKSLNISDQTDISLNSSILEDSIQP